jgi:hypothetical protein
MKPLFRIGWLLFLAVSFVLSPQAQVFDHLRALAGSRFPMGDPFTTVTNLNGHVEDGPKDIAVADLDMDGKLDVLASDKDGSITIYYGKGDGNFSVPSILRTWIGAPRDAQGLSMLKVITNNTLCMMTNRWESNGIIMTNWTLVCLPGIENTVTNKVLLSDGPTGLRGLAVADFTGDRLPDIAVASPGESVIYLFENKGDRHFESAREIPAWLGVRDLAAGDFDGDGKPDLAAAGTTNGVAQLKSLGNGTFAWVTNLPSLGTKKIDDDFPQPAFYLKAYRPKDALKDDLIVGRAQGEVSVLTAGAEGRLEISSTLTNLEAHALDAAPLLQPRTSGRPDLVSVNHSDEVLEILPGVAGPERFTTNGLVTINVPGRAHGVAVADLDNDGWNDLVVVLQRFSKVRVFRNNHGSFEPLNESSVGSGPRELATGDFNGDGRGDAAVLNRVSNDASILLSHPTDFGFSTLDMLYPADGEVVSLQVYDFNKDGRDDVVQLHRSAGQMSVRLARRDGSLSEPVFYGIGEKPSDTRIVDLNHDGVLDLLAVDLGGFVTVRLGKGDGTFGPEIRTLLKDYSEGSWGRGALFSLTTGDFNNDGNVDIAAGYLDCRVGFFQGNGDGTFTHTQTHVLGYETHGLATGDFDGDGKIDLAASPWDGSLIIVRNHGDLLTTPVLDRRVIAATNALSGAWTILVTDYNSDGDIDLLVDGGSGYTLYLGGPGVSFQPGTNIVKSSTNPTITPVIADFDGDGRPDLVSACADKSCVRVSLGLPGGGYGEPFEIGAPSSQLIATGDLDGDGRPDLIGTGEVLWTALSSRGPAPALPRGVQILRQIETKPVINELLANNSSFPLPNDGGRNSDFVEIFNGGKASVSMLNWKLRLARTNSTGLRTTNDFLFPPNTTLAAEARLVVVFSEKIRSPFHTGFKLPAEGAELCLLRGDESESDRLRYPTQREGRAYARFQDGVNGFVVTDSPTPGQPNADTGLLPPTVSIDDFNLNSAKPNQPIQFFARAKDDLGIVNLSLVWRRLDVADTETKRVVLYDDGQHDDKEILDGLFSGVLTPGLPAAAQMQFYLECTDLSGQVTTLPGNPRFVSPGQKPTLYTLGIGQKPPGLEISEIVAVNDTGITDEQGRRSDWVEIRNTSTNRISLSGVSLAPGYFSEDNRMDFTAVNLAPGEHVVVYADSKPSYGDLHLPFKLDRDGDQLVLTGTTPLGGKYVIDSVSFGRQTADTGLSRLGPGGVWVEGTPTPRSANVARQWRGVIKDNRFILAYPTRIGKTYVVEHKENLTDSWTTMPPTAGTGIELTIDQPILTTRFFRVREI